MTDSLTTPNTTSTSTPHIPAAHRQAKYQVRFDWASAGAAAVAADADVVVWVDALPADGPTGAVEAAPALAAAPAAAAVLAAGLTDAPAVARWILDEQVRLGRRAMIALVAAGGTAAGGTAAGGTAADPATPRFAVEDLLAAGAVVDALAASGIDYSSPEAAAACAAFTGLRGAVAHLLTASVSGQELVAQGITPADVAPAGRLDTSADVRVLRAPTA
ncbi:2-phosphosulfolactate phosphatase [Leifsonia sp. F6_8S_P_1B]|uniref:Probable 2-phosphosulfolactate phosphatase n=1 Tax=Leifsonia williamsii TaxID=3035919 RepID=A0ABT8KFN5_9MICO|nr:2-phosphosulfolactate phosphatase [Leifsonia williamsii]MDN4616264.1 2-phosphosulfolactate phosphatase [Leifsonia williamsii]